MTERQYRLSRLKEAISGLTEKKIVLYGTGKNAELILSYLHPASVSAEMNSKFESDLFSNLSLNIVGLMDGAHTGKYFYGKKVLSEEEILELNVDVILIAAQMQSAEMVYQRIMPFCKMHNILLLDMYGCDQIALHEAIRKQEIAYDDFDEEYIKRVISSKRILCIPISGTLCTFADKKIYELIEKECKRRKLEIVDFTANRAKAEKQFPAGTVYSLKELYQVFADVAQITRKKAQLICELEEEIIFKNLFPRKEIISIIHWAVAQQKEIYFYSDFRVAEDKVKEFLHQLGIDEYAGLLTEYISGYTLHNGLLYELAQQYDVADMLFIGSNRKNQLMVSQLYGIDILLMKEGVDLCWEYAKTSISKENFIINCFCREKTRDILNKMSSPYPKDYAYSLWDNDIRKVLGLGEKYLYPTVLLPELNLKKSSDIELLEFPNDESAIVSIIIPVYNQFGYTYNCLKSILQNTVSVAYEIIVADDCSADETRELERYVSGIQVIHNDVNMNFLGNCNNAAKHASGKYLVFLNNDTQVQYNWLMPLVHTFEEKQDTGIAGSKLIYPDGTLWEAGGIVWSSGEALNYGRGEGANAPEYNYVREVDYISGASIMISKELWESIGGFDSRFAPAYYEDTDLAFEVRKRKKKVIYQPDSVVVHFGSVSNSTNNYIKRNRAVFYEKWKDVLEKEQYIKNTMISDASDRKKRKEALTEGAMEKAARYQQLKEEKWMMFQDKKILIYGTGVIAKRLIRTLSKFHIVGAVDRLYFGGEVEGVPILIWDEIVPGSVDVVIIASLEKNYWEIYQRILDKCMVYGMSIYGGNGDNLIATYGWNVMRMENARYYGKSEDQLRQLIAQYDAISFDLFDTLIMRKTLEPMDVFDIVEDRAKKEGILVPGFKVLRREAELRSNSGNIDQIYDKLEEIAALNREQGRRLREIELACEKEVLLPRETMTKLLAYAKRIGKKVSIISDMYLGEAIIGDFLKELHIEGIDKIYVSCDYGISKGTGLFELYLKDVKGMKCLHIGDNEAADVMAPKKYGIDSYGIKSALDMAKISNFRYLLPMANNCNEKSLLGMVFANLFNNPFALYGSSGIVRIESYEKLGAAFAAPIALMYIFELLSYLKEHSEYDKILFGARDGYLFRKLYDGIKNMEEQQNLPEAVYILASRRLCIRATMGKTADIVVKSLGGIVRENILAGILGISEKEVAQEGNDREIDRQEYYEEHWKEIQEKSKLTKEGYLKYLKTCGIELSKKYLFMELVSRGTVQFALNQLFYQPLDGFYLCKVMSEKPYNLNVESVYQDKGNLMKKYYLLESIFTSPDPSVDDVKEDGGLLFCDETRTKDEIAYVLKEQQGVENFFFDYYSHVWVKGKEIKRELPEALLNLCDQVEYVGACKDVRRMKLYDDLAGRYTEVVRGD